jgi:hypothetical protein
MAQPTNKSEFREYCLRKLGKPVIEINVDQDQADDRIDEALSYYQDYHFDGVEKTYVKYRVLNSYVEFATLEEGDFVVGEVISEYEDNTTADATATATATIVAIDVTNKRVFFKKPTFGDFDATKFVSSPAFAAKHGTAASNRRAITTAFKGTYELRYIPVPENIIGAINVFTPESNATFGNGIFNAKYQYVLHNLHDINMGPLINFQMSMQHMQLIEELLVGKVPMRYNRHQDKISLDMDWDNLTVGTYIVVEAYQVVDPQTFSDVWKDRWLQNYATAKIKYQWGSNITKFAGLTLPGNIQFNGEQILNDAREEIQRLEEEIINSYSLPASDMIG